MFMLHFEQSIVAMGGDSMTQAVVYGIVLAMLPSALTVAWMFWRANSQN